MAKFARQPVRIGQGTRTFTRDPAQSVKQKKDLAIFICRDQFLQPIHNLSSQDSALRESFKPKCNEVRVKRSFLIFRIRSD